MTTIPVETSLRFETGVEQPAFAPYRFTKSKILTGAPQKKKGKAVKSSILNRPLPAGKGRFKNSESFIPAKAVSLNLRF